MFPHVVQWMRITNTAPKTYDERRLAWTVFASPQPSDIQQGILGDCWFVAALSLIAQRPNLLHRLLLTQTVNTAGIYRVRICHNGLWKIVVIDDSFPSSNGFDLVFTQAKHRQMYAPLLEKACAKIFGSFAALENGSLMEGLHLMTGAPCEYIDLHPSVTKLDKDLVWSQLMSACQEK